MAVRLRSGVAVTVMKLAVVMCTAAGLSVFHWPGAQSSVMGPTALAATTACGTSCTVPVNLSLGTGQTPTITITGSGCPAVTAAGLESAAGNSACTIKVAMASADPSNAGQDWVSMEEGTVDKFISDQALSQRLDIQYGSDEVVEFEAAPDGVASNLCLAIVSGTGTLRPCGGATSEQTDAQTGSQTDKGSSTNSGSDSTSYSVVCCPYAYTYGSSDSSSGSSSNTDTTTSTGTDTTTTSTYSGTAWILDGGNTSNGYLDVISGSDQAYSDPLVLTASSSGSLGLSSLSEIGGVVTTTQMWAFPLGPTPAPTSTPTPTLTPTPTPTSTPATVYYSGPGCGTQWSPSGSWYDLAGSATSGCGDAMTRKQTGNHGDMDWYFSPGAGASCTIQAYIPNSSAITATAAHYQLYAASGHTSLASDVKLSQAGDLGSWLTIGTFTTASGAFDLLLNDDVSTGLIEVAGPATATCTAPSAAKPAPAPAPAGR